VRKYIVILLAFSATAVAADLPTDSAATPAATASVESATTIGEEATKLVEEHAAEQAEFRTPAGYKKKKKGDQTMYCKSQTPIGTRFPTEYCYTQNQLERIEKSKQGMQDDVAMRQRACTTGSACGGS
jgi:invasion protein IalB